MKKISKVLLAILTIAMTTPVVNAASTMNKGTNIVDYVSSSSTNYEFEDKDDITYLTVTVEVNDGFKNDILSHVPGQGNSQASNANLGKVYYGLKTGFCQGCTTVKTSHTYYTGSVDEAKNTLDTTGYTVDSDKGDVYITLVEIEYNDGNGWKTLSGEADGSTSIGSKLVSTLGLSGTHELKYGENYRFHVDTTKDLLIGFEVDSTPKKYVSISTKVKFPVYGEDDEGKAVYYDDLQEALNADGINTVYVTEDYDADDTIVVPEGIELVVTNDATIKLQEGKELIVNGYFYAEGNSKVTIGDKEAYEVIAYTRTGNGTITASKSFATEGEIINLTITPVAGYKLKSLSVEGSIGDEWKNLPLLADQKSFTMPASTVVVVADFEKIVATQTAITPPNTNDINIGLIISIITLSTIGIAVSKKKIKASIK